MIKKTNDFVLGIMMLLLSAALFFGEVTDNVPEFSQGGFIARADVWVQMLAVFLAVVSVALILSAVNPKKEKVPFQFAFDGTAAGTVISLVLYAALFPILGFGISTFLMVTFLTGLYTVKEEELEVKKIDKATWLRISRKSILTGIVMLAVLWLVFGKLLAVQLP